MTPYSAKKLLEYIQDDSGAELSEWVLVVSLITGAAAGLFALLNDSLGLLITDFINSIQATP